MRNLRKLLVRSVSEPVEGGVRVSREAVDVAALKGAIVLSVAECDRGRW
jgi:hypothetical protein